MLSLRPLLTLSLGSAVLAAAAYFALAAPAGDGGAQAQAAPPLRDVEVTVLTPSDVRTWTRASGRLAPVERAAVKPQVGGTLREVLFVDGQQVKAGDPLFLIDPRPFEAQVQQARAQQATAEARADLAQREVSRARQLAKEKLVAKSVLDTAENEYKAAAASVQAAAGAVAAAELDLEYAHVTAPISGRVGRAEVTAGNTVAAGAAAPTLTTIVADDRFYAEFDISELAYLDLSGAAADMPVELSPAGRDALTYRGQLYAFDNHIDPASGTVRARALFDNEDGRLIAGMFVNVRLGSAATQPLLLVPERAIGTNQDKKFVYVVGEDQKVAYREVQLGAHHQGSRAVAGGVQAGDRVVVNSLAHLRPGAEINPVEVAAADLASD